MKLFRKLLLCCLILVSVLQVSGQTILKQDGKFGLSDEKGNVILEPKYDTVIGHRDVPSLFVAEINNKFLFTYYLNWDSLDPLPEKERHWYVSDLEFDSVYFLRGCLRREESIMEYTSVGYRVNALWGLIYIQSHTASGYDFYASDYICCLGKQYRLPSKYDKILDGELDYFYTTYLGGKYGLWNPLTGEEYQPEFDTVPIFLGKWDVNGKYDRLRYVRKNNKWGIIRMDKIQRMIKYIAPCQHTKIEKVDQNVHASIGYGDTLTFFFTTSDYSFRPYCDGAPIIFEKDSLKVRIGMNGSPDASVRNITVKIDKIGNKSVGYCAIYYIDTLNKKTTPFIDSTYSYFATSYLMDAIIYRWKKQPVGQSVQYDFYSINSAEFLFSLKLDTIYDLQYEFIEQRKPADSPAHFVERYFYYDARGKERTLGYYSHTSQKFSQKKPRM